jgi:2-oxoglutarate ferredoxin oxidoreductase subunit alpha
MNLGQMLEDVKISVGEQASVHFHGRPGGVISTPHEVENVIKKLMYEYELDK